VYIYFVISKGNLFGILHFQVGSDDSGSKDDHNKVSMPMSNRRK